MGHVTRAQWYNTSLVVRKILQYFSSKEILSLLLVNQEWNFCAKSLLKIRGNIVAKIGNCPYRVATPTPIIFQATNQLQESFEKLETSSLTVRQKNSTACEDLIKFAKTMQGASTTPITGLDINAIINHAGPCPRLDKAAAEIIVTKVMIQRLEITIWSPTSADGGGEVTPCCILQSLKTLFKLNELPTQKTSVLAPPAPALNLGLTPALHELTNLQVVKFEDTRYFILHPRKLLFMKQLLAKAPNLKELHLELALDDADDVEWLKTRMDGLLGGTSALVVCEFTNYGSGELDPAEVLTENQFSRLALREYDDASVEVFSKGIISTVLPNSRATLIKAKLHAFRLAKILQHGICFENLMDLTVEMNFSYFRRKYPAFVEKILRRNLWKRCFPHLRKLSVCEPEHDGDQEEFVLEDDYEAEIVEKINAFSPDQTEHVEDSHLQVSSLKLVEDGWPGVFLTDRELELVCSLCPYTKELKMHRFYGTYPYIWGHLQNIESCHIVIEETENMDAAFCGMHPEEVEELKGRGVEYLKAVHIVPMQPPITHLPSLKHLHLECRSDQDGNFIFSKITAAICFSRMPGLVIELDSYTKMPEGQTAMQFEFRAAVKDFPEVRFKTQTLKRDGNHCFFD